MDDDGMMILLLKMMSSGVSGCSCSSSSGGRKQPSGCRSRTRSKDQELRIEACLKEAQKNKAYWNTKQPARARKKRFPYIMGAV